MPLRSTRRAPAGYPISIEQDVSKERLEHFFVKGEHGYTIRKDIRDQCIFAKHDVTEDPPFSSLDLISCRNVLIYLGTSLQDRVLSRFHYALKERGFLVLGTSESAHSHPGFLCVDNKIKLHTRTSVAPSVRAAFPEINRDEARLARMSHAKDRHQGLDVAAEADRLLLATFAPPGVVVSAELTDSTISRTDGGLLGPRAWCCDIRSHANGARGASRLVAPRDRRS